MSVRSAALVMTMGLVFSSYSFAQSDQNPPSDMAMSGANQPAGAFQNDPSAPAPNIDSEIPQYQLDHAAVTPQSNMQWDTYNRPLRDCLQGNTIIPSNGNDLFGFLFNTNSPANVNMAIQGWKNGSCAVNFTEGTAVMYCRLGKEILDEFMHSLLYDNQFDRAGSLAQTLTEDCQNTDPDQQARVVADQSPQDAEVPQ
jgi:hypothetical protein